MARIVVTQDNTTVVVGNGDTVVVDIPGGGTVTIVADPNANIQDLKIEFRGDSQSDTVIVDLATFDDDGLHIDIKDYDSSDNLQLKGAKNKQVNPDRNDELLFDYVGSDGQTYSGYVRAKDNGEKDFTADPSPINVICFADSAIIDTDIGPRPVSSLLVGDLVVTQGRGLQPVRWIGKRRLDSFELARNPHLYPIRVRQGALGNGLPYLDLLLSPQHRILISDWRTEYLFGETSVLVAVKHLVNDVDIVIERDAASVCYYHILLDNHEMLTANGVPSESLFYGDMTRDALDHAARAEIHQLFPDLAVSLADRRTAVPVLRAFEAEAVRAYAS